MKKLRLYISWLLYHTGRFLSWRRLMLLAGVSLLAAVQSCRTARPMCYDVAPADTTDVSNRDSLYMQIDCYEIPNYPDTFHLDSKEETPKEID